MKKSVKELNERNLEIRSEQKEIKTRCDNEQRDMSDAEIAAFDALDSEYAENEQAVKTQERFAKIAGDKAANVQSGTKNSIITRSDKSNALRAWAASNSRMPLQSNWTQAAERCAFELSDTFKAETPAWDDVGIKERTSNGQLIGTAIAGGNTIQSEAGYIFLDAMKQNWNWGPYVDVLQTSVVAPYTVHTEDDTANEGAYVNENTAPTVVDRVFGRSTISLFKISSGIWPITKELIKSSRIDMLGTTATKLGQRMARKLSKELTLGTLNKMGGFVGSTTLGATSASETDFSLDNLIDLTLSLEPHYLDNAVFMMNAATLAFILKKKDSSNNRYLLMPFNDPLYDKVRYQILGYPVVINNNIPATLAADAVPVYFGDFKAGMKLVLFQDVEVSTSYEKYWAEDSVAMKATTWAGSKFVNPGDNPVKHLKLAADE